MCASKEVRCSGSLIVSLVPHNFTFLLCESEQKNKRHVTRGSRALVMNNFSCKRHIQGTKLLKENKKSILPKASYSGEDSIKAFTLGVTSSRLYAWDVQHRLVKRNKLKQQWYSLGVQRLLTNHKKLLCLSPHMLGVTDHLSSVIWHETSGRWQWSWTRRSRLDCVCRGVTYRDCLEIWRTQCSANNITERNRNNNTCKQISHKVAARLSREDCIRCWGCHADLKSGWQECITAVFVLILFFIFFGKDDDKPVMVCLYYVCFF